MVVFADEDKKSQICNIKEAMEESDLPFTVDVLVWDDIPESFHKNIEEEYLVTVAFIRLNRQPVFYIL